MRKLLYTITVLALVTAGLWAQSSGGAFIPSADYNVTGLWNFTQTPTFGASGAALVTTTGTQTLTNKTLTAPVLGGSITGTYTLAGTPTITAPALGGTVTGTYTLGGTPTLASAAGVPYVAGVASGYKLARGHVTLDGTNPTSAATGLTTVVECFTELQATSAPAVTFLTSIPNTTNLDIYAWAPTASGDTALTASSNSALVVSWACIGT